MKKLIILFFIIPQFLFGQLTPELADDLKAELIQAIEENTINGISASVVFPNGDVWADAYGEASSGEALRSDHHLYSGSTTKTMIAAIIMQLQEEGLLNIDEPIENYIGEYAFVDENITLRRLLNHTSGIYNYTMSNSFWLHVQNNPSIIITPSQIMDYVDSPVFIPGTTFGYSNTNYILLSLIIEAVTQSTLEDALRSRIFEPLAFETMFLGAYESSIGDYGGMWLDEDGNGSLEDYSDLNTNSILSGAWGAGALATTPADLALWVKKLYGSSEVVTAASLQDMTTGSDQNTTYGLGTVLGSYDGCSLIGHSGGIIHTTEMRYIPELDMSVSMIVNGGTYDFEEFLAIIDILKDQFLSSTNDIAGIEINFSPNPFSEDLQLEWKSDVSGPISIEFFSADGKRLSTQNFEKLSAGQEINLGDYLQLAHLPKGVLYYTIKSGQGSTTGKLVHIDHN